MPKQRNPQLVPNRPLQIWLGENDSDIRAHLEKLGENQSEYIRALIRADITGKKQAVEKIRAALLVIEAE